MGNFSALCLAQSQLIEFSALVSPIAEKYKVSLNTLTPLPLASIAWFYWTVVSAVSFGILFITYRRNAFPSRPNPAALGALRDKVSRDVP